MGSTIVSEVSSIGTVARKRRRQILQSQRIKTNEDIQPASKKACVEPITSSALRKVSDAQAVVTPKTGGAKAKKPQMRYDPDVPMTKEEAAAWRKEQRRKRNRESAAASRQRQRDRISELEQEVSEWKSKYEQALARIERLEKLREANLADCNTELVCSAPELPPKSTAVSPCSSPHLRPSSPCTSKSSCGVVSLPEQCSGDEMESPNACEEMRGLEFHAQHLSEKISRPA